MMKNYFTLKSVILATLVLVIYLLSTCKKGDDPSTDTNKPAAPSAYTDTSTFVSQAWATLNSLIGANNALTTISFEYDTSTTYRYSIAAKPDTLSGRTTTKRIAELSGLSSNTTYHYRVKAVNSIGTSYGSDKKFITLPVYEKDLVFNPDLTYDQITDIDGNTYKTIEIGTQVWMAENLAATKFNDGTGITWATNSTSLTPETLPYYSWYNNVTLSYGALYNWYAVSSGKLCPAGWHVPTDDEWTTLSTSLGGLTVAGSKLKETGVIHWQSPNSTASNSSGFTALPGGYRYYSGTFNGMKRYGYWWTSSESTTLNGYARDMYYGYSNLDRISSDKRSGASVRCVKN